MNISNSFGAWSNHIPNSDLNKTIDYVLTGYNIDTIKPSANLLSYINREKGDSGLTILDFGCGIGRNLIFLSQSLPTCKIYGYDNDNMLSQAKKFAIQKYDKNLDTTTNIALMSNWDTIKHYKFDFIYATLVFQHIVEDALSQYLIDIKSMTDTLLVESRRYNDDFESNTPIHKNTWKILEKNGLYPYFCTQEYAVDGDPEDHFLCIYKITENRS